MYVSLFKNLSNGVSKGGYGEDSLVIKNGDQSLKVLKSKSKNKSESLITWNFFLSLSGSSRHERSDEAT